MKTISCRQAFIPAISTAFSTHRSCYHCIPCYDYDIQRFCNEISSHIAALRTFLFCLWRYRHCSFWHLFNYLTLILMHCINYMLWRKELDTYSHPVMHLTLLTSISWSMICRTTCNFPPNSCANISFWIYIQNYISNIAQKLFCTLASLK